MEALFRLIIIFVKYHLQDEIGSFISVNVFVIFRIKLFQNWLMCKVGALSTFAKHLPKEQKIIRSQNICLFYENQIIVWIWVAEAPAIEWYFIFILFLGYTNVASSVTNGHVNFAFLSLIATGASLLR